MDLVHFFVDFFLHLDKHLAEVIQAYGAWTYGLLFTIVFLETGLVVTPLLPGDSLLFAAGSFAALGALDIGLLFVLLSSRRSSATPLNYAIGHYLGPRVFHFPKSRFFNPEHLRKTHEFYEKYGGKTIIIARFVPIVRTFAPFVAGIGAMSYARFLRLQRGGRGAVGGGLPLRRLLLRQPAVRQAELQPGDPRDRRWSRCCRRSSSTCATAPEARRAAA